MGLEAVLSCIALLLLTGIIACGAARGAHGRVGVYGTAATASGLMLLVAGGSLVTGGPATDIVLPLGIPWIGAHFRLDALAAFFLVVVNLGGTAASIYAIGYGRHETAPMRVLPWFPLFLAAMNLVVIAADAFVFLFSWELMSLASWALVMAHHRKSQNAHAGYIYVLMAAFGVLVLLLCFGLLAGPEGNYTFDDIRQLSPTPVIGGAVLALALIGAGSKAGVVPLHVWLPLAHPAAPSHVSALMSGVMTKVAVYGFVRIVFDLAGPPAGWWSAIVLIVGGATAVLGLLYALMQHDLKRLLAYSTVENVGIIFIGLGLSLAFTASGMAVPAALALTAALFHVLNHCVFKSLLFFGAGAVLNATGERDMEQLGGLIHRMPTTAATVLVGCAAISALPPLNGFVSEWLTFQAILISPQIPEWGLKFLIPAVGAALALSAALAAACFVKAFGITFLGQPRSVAAAEAKEVDAWSRSVMIALAILCILGGVLPGLVVDALSPVVAELTSARLPVQASAPWLSLVPIAQERSSYNGILVLIFITMSGFLAAFAIHRLASRRVRRGPAWDCGFAISSPKFQYTASSFSQPIRREFGSTVFAASESIDMPPPSSLAPARFTLRVRDLIWEFGYLPLGAAVRWAADNSNRLQFLTIRGYLGLVFAALVVLLVGIII